MAKPFITACSNLEADEHAVHVVGDGADLWEWDPIKPEDCPFPSDQVEQLNELTREFGVCPEAIARFAAGMGVDLNWFIDVLLQWKWEKTNIELTRAMAQRIQEDTNDA